MKITHPLSPNQTVEYDAKRCNCLLKKKQLKIGKIVRVLNFNGSIWYSMDTGQQIIHSKVTRVI